MKIEIFRHALLVHAIKPEKFFKMDIYLSLLFGWRNLLRSPISLLYKSWSKTLHFEFGKKFRKRKKFNKDINGSRHENVLAFRFSLSTVISREGILYFAIFCLNFYIFREI